MSAMSKEKSVVEKEDIIEAAKSTLYFEDKANSGA
jgi:hypothetical protein